MCVAISRDSGTPSARTRSKTISPQAAAVASNQFIWPYAGVAGMVIDVDDEEPLQAGDAGARQVAALHDDDGRVVAGLDVDAIGDLDVRHAGKLHQRRRRRVGVDDRHLLAERAQRIGGGQLRADRVAVGTRVRGDDEPLPGANGVDDLLKLRTRHRHRWRRGRSAARAGVLDLVQQLLDAVLAGDRFVVDERQLGDALQAEPRPDLPAQERRRPLERAAAVRARLVVAERRCRRRAPAEGRASSARA